MPPTNFDFGPELYNVNPTPRQGGSWLEPTDGAFLLSEHFPRATTNANILQMIVNYVASNGGGYVYFPPGRYYVGRPSFSPILEGATEYPDLFIPTSVTLWFAPGAALIPLSYIRGELGGGREWRPVPGLSSFHPDTMKVRIEIQGDIIADLRPIFDVGFPTRRPDPTLGFVVDPLRPAGRILLTGNRIREVYPEWWGAVSEDVGNVAAAIRTTTLALNATIEAAYTWRSTPHRRSDGTLPTGVVEWNVRPAIPVVAQGTYVIDDEVVVLPPDHGGLWTEAPMRDLNPGGFELIGEHSVGTPGQGVPNIVASAYSSAPFRGTAMLKLIGVLDFSIRGMSFNGEHVAPTIVSVKPLKSRWSYCEFEGCTFLHPAAACVALDARDVSSAERLRDFWNTLFSRCHFDQGSVAALAARIRPPMPNGVQPPFSIPDREGNLVAMDLFLEDNEGLEVRGSTFFGHASPAIRARSGRFALNEVNLHVIRARHSALIDPMLSEATQNSADPRLSPNFRHGTDIFLESDPAPVPGRSLDPWRVTPPAFTAREIESQSWQFLATEGSATSPPGRDMSPNAPAGVVLLNVHHAAVWNRTGDIDPNENLGPHAPTPPGIFWGDPGVRGSPLIMIGCQFHGQFVRYMDASRTQVAFAERSIVYVAPGIRGEIYNIGAHVHGTWAPPGPMPARVTRGTQDTVIRVYQAEQWHRIPRPSDVEAEPELRSLRVRQLTSRAVGGGT